MSNQMMYLKEDVYFEPLFNHWYAWPYLMPPASAARHVVNTHRRVMLSFINNYKLHIMASKEAVLAGGEFLNCKEEQVDDIKALVNEQASTCDDLIQLSDAIKDMDELVFSHTSGESIEYLYAKVPEMLKGYVEIFMDMEHRAGYRFIESLLYKSKFYKPNLQSLAFGVLSKVGERPFVLSTPRLPDDNHLHINENFTSQIVDTIFKSREIPISTQTIEQCFTHLNMSGGLTYKDLFTTEKPETKYIPVTSGLRLSYTGHAGFLIETPDVSIMIDPVIACKNDNDPEEMIGFSDLPAQIDYILLTHTHMDHVCIETLLQLRYKVKKVLVPRNNGGSIVDPSISLLLRQLGFNVSEVDDLEEIPFANGQIVSMPFLGEHGDLNIRSKTAWYIEAFGRKCFFGADSSNPDPRLYEHLAAIYPDIDVLAIGMECVGAPYTWIYGALHTKKVPKNIKQSRRLNGSDFEQALPMVSAFNASQVFIYALGLEVCYKYFMGIVYDENSMQIVESNKLLNACEKMGIPAHALKGKRVLTLDPKTN
ncbi:MBL fold metallo-hydrolase [Marinicellulosiphila megalodicopiae]|uniref:MBL fold metallo-hydrolase n=1 Tax=Marinicellulosiphila megalodicopiae TaxID=2724896 RepID=UPI003BAF11C3